MSDIILSPNSQYLEQVMTKALLEDKDYVVNVTRVFEEHYFDSAELQQIFSYISSYFKTHREIPTKDTIINSVPIDSKESVQNYLDELETIDIDVVRHHDWLMEQTDTLLRDKSIKDAIRRSVDIIDANENTNDIRQLIEDALCRTMDVDLGLDYFGALGTRLHKMFTDDTQRIPTYFPVFDEFINGGFPPKTLSVLTAKVHGHKSNVMANMIARQVLNGHNVALASLEMSEEMFAQRFDGIYSKLDINKFYFNQRLQSQLVDKLRNVKATEGRGQLFIKSFPTGKASVADFRIWMRELKLRGFEINIFYFDYLNLMASEEIKKGDNTYLQVKSIAEESRAMGFEFDIPMVSVSQLNRAGTFMSFEEVDFNSIADSYGIPATADFLAIMGSDDEHMVYSNEVHYKISKNRFGGRVGEIDKFYYDARSMKMYCSSELNLWMDDVMSSGDDRELYQQGE